MAYLTLSLYRPDATRPPASPGEESGSTHKAAPSIQSAPATRPEDAPLSPQRPAAPQIPLTAMSPQEYRPQPGRPLLADPDLRARRVEQLTRQNDAAQKRAEAWAAQTGEPVRFVTNGTVVLLVDYRDDMGPLYMATFNANAAISTAADVLHAAPYALTGTNVLAGIWDGGNVRAAHVELTGRVTNFNGVANDDHATHVAGTMLASGVSAAAKGMAPAARLHAYDFNNDLAEMTARAMADPSETNQVQISNHSYGYLSGYATQFSPRRWYGTWFMNYRESDYFGVYSSIDRDYDALCYDAPYYLPFKAAGNDRTDAAPSSGANFQYYNGTSWITKAYDPAADPFSDFHKSGGYDTIALSSSSKNMVIVGAVNDAVSGGVRHIASATMAGFSSWGPTDDGRIKPDLVANGLSVYSSGSGGNTTYTTKQGTSMATPNASGSALLLVELYKQRFSNALMRASTIKALMIHTADDLHNAGPDYRTGWGLVNVHAAAEQIIRHHTFPTGSYMVEDLLTGDVSESVFSVHWDNTSPIRATLAWTDPPGPEQWGLNITNLALVNDLDMRIITPTGATNYPWVLEPTNFNALATTGDNFRDNVEQVFISAPPTSGVYQIRITHKNALTNGFQHFSLIISGTTPPLDIAHTPLINTTNDALPYVISATITPTQLVDVATVELLWNDTGDTELFTTNAFSWVADAVYEAEIPAQPVGTDLHYFIRATSTNGITTTHPADAPASLHTFSIRPPVVLTVTGTPVQVGVVTPDYGDTIFAIGNNVQADAPVFSDPSAGERYRVTGWTGSGDAPAAGDTNTLSFTIATDSTLEWQWVLQFSMVETSSVPGLLFTETWRDENLSVTPQTASLSIEQDAIHYRFAEWRLNDLRQTNDWGASINPVPPFDLDAPAELLAVYFPEDQDSDENGLPDWWQIFHFGALGNDPGDDPDGDGFDLLTEFLDGTDPLDETSIPEPPVLLHTALTDPQGAPAPFLVAATITDNYGVAAATLWWNRNEEGWNDAPLHHVGGDTYTNAIPAPGGPGDTFDYYLTAADFAGLTTTNGPYAFHVEFPIIGLTPTNEPFFLLQPGQTTNFWVTVTNSGNTELEWQLVIEPAGFYDTIETGTNGWSSSGDNNYWHISTNRSTSGTHAWYNGLPGTNRYTANMLAALDLPPVLLHSSNPKLTFNHWIEAEINDTASAWHGGLVAISPDNGATFYQLTPAGGYPYVIAWWAYAPFPFLTPIYAGTGGWQQATFDLTGYAGQTVILRFLFGSDTVYAGHEGWYIDDVRITPRTGSHLWLSSDPMDDITAPHTSTQLLISVSTEDVATGEEYAASLQFESNDPVHPILSLPVQMQVRTQPVLHMISAAQSSTNGTGRVTVEADVFNPDPEPMAWALEVSTNNGVSWNNAWILSAQADWSTPAVTNPGVPQITGIASGNGVAAMTNRASAIWSTTNAPAIVLSTSTLVRARVWDGFFWSDYDTSDPFLVDNEPPGAPGDLTSPSHMTGLWHTINTVLAEWSAATDGEGIGVARYAVRAGPGQIAPSISNTVLVTEATFTGVADSSNIWIGVRAIDAFGNASAASLLGPFKIDATPPDASTAVVQIAGSAFGPYTLSPVLTNTWSGFSDSVSGIAGYYFDLEDGSGTTNGWWTEALTGELVTTNVNATNVVFVWARDIAGNIGAAAAGSLLVLTGDGDWDGDGVSNFDEEIAGTSSADDTSLFTGEGIVDQDDITTATLRWPWAEGRSYIIEWTGSLEAPIVWTEIADPAYTVNQGWAEWSDPSPITPFDAKRYYRIIARLVVEE